MARLRFVLLYLAVTVGLMVLLGLLIHLVVWATMDSKRGERQRTYSGMILVGGAVERYRKAHGRCPTWGELDEATRHNTDVWGHPLAIVAQESGCRIVSYGSDGAPGGVGLDTDFALGDDVASLPRPTFPQYLREKSDRGDLVSPMLMLIAPVTISASRLAGRKKR